MGYSIINQPQTPQYGIGEITEKDTGNRFEVFSGEQASTFWDQSYLTEVGATHMIQCNTINQNDLHRSEYRLVQLKKTVVYVLVDEDEEGQPVWEKWSLKNNNVA